MPWATQADNCELMFGNGLSSKTVRPRCNTVQTELISLQFQPQCRNREPGSAGEPCLSIALGLLVSAVGRCYCLQLPCCPALCSSLKEEEITVCERNPESSINSGKATEKFD